jgi:hypothetical protein
MLVGTSMKRIDFLPPGKCTPRTPAATFGLVHLLALALLFFPLAAEAAATRQQPERQPLGSLDTIGQVYVNDSAAPAESTIFAGDTLRTADGATATFTPSGRGSLKISPRSQLAFSSSPQYLAELKSGMVVVSTLSGGAGVSLRAGNFVVVAVTEGEQSTSQITAAADGSFTVTCLEGSVGVLPMNGASGLFLQAGQSGAISPQGQLAALTPPKQPPAPAPPSAPSPTTTTPTAAPKKSNTGLILLGVGAGVAVIAGVALGAGKSSSAAISPAGP